MEEQTVNPKLDQSLGYEEVETPPIGKLSLLAFFFALGGTILFTLIFIKLLSLF